MRLIIGIALFAGAVAGATLLWPTISELIRATDMSVLMAEFSSGLVPAVTNIWELLFNHLPEILFASAVLIFLNTIRKFPPRLLTTLSTAKGIELDQPSIASTTTMLVDEFEFTPLTHLKDPNSRIDTSIQQNVDSEHESGSDFVLDPITEARVFERFGRNPQAISLLMEKLSLEEENLDDMALELAVLFEEEIESRFDNDEDATDLFNQRDEFLELISRRSTLLSGQTWFILCEQFPNDLVTNTNIDRVLKKKQLAKN